VSDYVEASELDYVEVSEYVEVGRKHEITGLERVASHQRESFAEAGMAGEELCAISEVRVNDLFDRLYCSIDQDSCSAVLGGLKT